MSYYVKHWLSIAALVWLIWAVSAGSMFFS
jgi:hypothetical protein